APQHDTVVERALAASPGVTRPHRVRWTWAHSVAAACVVAAVMALPVYRNRARETSSKTVVDARSPIAESVAVPQSTAPSVTKVAVTPVVPPPAAASSVAPPAAASRVAPPPATVAERERDKVVVSAPAPVRPKPR